MVFLVRSTKETAYYEWKSSLSPTPRSKKFPIDKGKEKFMLEVEGNAPNNRDLTVGFSFPTMLQHTGSFW